METEIMVELQQLEKEIIDHGKVDEHHHLTSEERIR